MIDFAGQVVIPTYVLVAGVGLARPAALDSAKRGAAVVVNDVGTTMRGEGSDSGVADQVVKEIESWGGMAVASHQSVATPEGGESIVRGGHRTVRPTG